MDFKEECFRFACKLSLERRELQLENHSHCTGLWAWLWEPVLITDRGGVWLSVGSTILKQVGSGL